MAKRRTYTDDEKAHAIAIAQAHGPAEASRQTGIGASTIKSWMRRLQPSASVATSATPPERATPTQPELDLALECLEGLTHMQAMFAVSYVGRARGNKTEAARLAGYSGDNAQLAVQGYQTFRNPKVREAIGALMKPLVMEQLEVLWRTSEEAQADMGDFLDDEDPHKVDLKKAQARGKLHLIKEIQTETTTTKKGEATRKVKIKLVDAQAAKRDLARLNLKLDEDQPPPGSEDNPIHHRHSFDNDNLADIARELEGLGVVKSPAA